MESELDQILKDEELIVATRTDNYRAGCFCAIVGVVAFAVSYLIFYKPDALSWNSSAFAVLFWVAFILSMWNAKLDEQERKVEGYVED